MKLVVDNDKLDVVTLKFDASQGQRMLAAVYGFLGRFVAYPSSHAQVAHTLWCVHTHHMDFWDSTPRIAFLSAEPSSGKSRALEVTSLLVPRPMQAVNMSSSALFRSMGSENGLPTILFDEIDTVFGPKAKENEDIRGLLNAGHRRGQKAYRSVMRGTSVEVEAIEAFSAVALAGIGWLPDTLLARSVIVRMRRRHAGELVEPFRLRLHENQGHGVRDLVEQWAQGAEIEWPDHLPNEIQDRDADVWEALIAIADAVGGEWPKLARDAAVTLVTESKEREPSLGVRLLADLRVIFGDAEAMSSKFILDALHNLEEAPWGDLKGKPLNERGLANRLRQYGVKSKTVRLGTPIKGYAREDLHDVWVRYLPSPLAGTNVTSVTSVTSLINKDEIGQFDENASVTTVTNLAADVTDVTDGVTHQKPKEANDVNDVTDVTDVTLPASKRTCDHCDLPETSDSELLTVAMGGPSRLLHRKCIALVRDNLDIPDFLDRRQPPRGV